MNKPANIQWQTDNHTHSWKGWRQSFLIYTLTEAVVIVIQYMITRGKCRECLMPVAFYIYVWLQHLVFTGLLWYCLQLVNHWNKWAVVLMNMLLLFVHYFLWIILMYLVFHSGIDWLTGNGNSNKGFRSLIYDSWPDIGKYVLKVSAFYALSFYFKFRKSAAQRVQLAVVNKELQLNLLKQQLSPHFYFNTLNNLYGMSMSNSSKLSGALRQLSSIMHYVLVDCNQPTVLLSQEIEFLQSYIALEKLRYEQHTVIEMNVTGQSRTQRIVPLLLIQFVENAFKHGMKEKSVANWMKVLLQIEKNELLLIVNNSCYEKKPSAGIGINSVMHLLNLQYEGKYQLDISNEINHFSVTLKLSLS